MIIFWNLIINIRQFSANIIASGEIIFNNQNYLYEKSQDQDNISKMHWLLQYIIYLKDEIFFHVNL